MIWVVFSSGACMRIELQLKDEIFQFEGKDSELIYEDYLSVTHKEFLHRWYATLTGIDFYADDFKWSPYNAVQIPMKVRLIKKTDSETQIYEGALTPKKISF